MCPEEEGVALEDVCVGLLTTVKWNGNIDVFGIGQGNEEYDERGMIDYDSYISTAQIRDLLNHVHSLHLDYTINGENIGEIPGCDEAWCFFKTLNYETRFYYICGMLNELNFKTTVHAMLLLIRSSAHPVTNGTFLCLQSHLRNLFALSVEWQSQSGKLDTAKTGHIKLMRFDDNMLWSPVHSEALLQNVSIPSLAATKMTPSASACSISAADLSLAVSSRMVLDPDFLRREVSLVISSQCRTMVGGGR